MDAMEVRPSCFVFRGIHRFPRPCLANVYTPSFGHHSLRSSVKWLTCSGVVENVPKTTSGLASKGSQSAGGGLCSVLWTIQADVAKGQLIYVSGDSFPLGSWEPELAVVLSPWKDHNNLWQIEIKVPCGVNLKYNYFITEDTLVSDDLFWRPGPPLSISIPKQHKGSNIMCSVEDSWVETRDERFPSQMWGSWLEVDRPIHKMFPVDQSLTAGTDHLFDTISYDPQKWQASSDCFMVKKEPYGDELGPMRIDGPPVKNNGSTSLVLYQLVEEPWLQQLPLVEESTDTSKQTLLEITTGCLFAEDESLNDAKIMGLEEEHRLAIIEKPVSTTILVNSSVCTMQRVAIMEDDKLVELLLEPVKNNVQCGSVYLGVVTKLVPHLGGAFVDIGISRASLMDIKLNRDPFVFSPLCSDSDILEVNDTVPEVMDQQKINKDVAISHDDASGNGFEGEAEDDSPLDDSSVDADLEDSYELADEGEFLLSESDHPSENISPQSVESNLVDAQLTTYKWKNVCKGTKVIVQVIKEELGTKGPTLTAYPRLRSRFWVLSTRCIRIGVSKKISGVERTRLKLIARTLQPPGFGLTVRSVAAGHALGELQKDLDGLIVTWKDIIEHAKSASLAADEGVEGAIPIMVHKAMGQTLAVVQDYFNEKVESMVVDSPRTYHEVTSYLKEVAPDLSDRVKLHDKRTPIFDDYDIEEEINNILSKRVPLPNGGSLVIEQTEALVSIDVNGGHGMLGHGISQQQAILDVNLAAAKQIARELRLRDIGGIIVVDFIDMIDQSNKRMVYEEIKRAVERDRSLVKVSELSKHALMEMTRKRVRPSVSFMISEPCSCCQATGRVEGLETFFSKIEREMCRLLAVMPEKPDLRNAKSWPKFTLRVDCYMSSYLTSGKRTRSAILSSSLKVWILLKVDRNFARGEFDIKPFTEDKTSNDHNQTAIPKLSPKGASIVPKPKTTVFPVKKWKLHVK